MSTTLYVIKGTNGHGPAYKLGYCREANLDIHLRIARYNGPAALWRLVVFSSRRGAFRAMQRVRKKIRAFQTQGTTSWYSANSEVLQSFDQEFRS